MQFKPPGEKERLAAIGPTDGLPETLRRALVAGDDFESIPQPGPSDWLTNHPEEGQTSEQFLRSRPVKPDKKRSKLYLQPLVEFASQGRCQDRIRRCTSRRFPCHARGIARSETARNT